MADKIVLLTHGEYSDYGIVDLIRIDEEVYKDAIARIEALQTQSEKDNNVMQGLARSRSLSENERIIWAKKSAENLAKQQEVWNEVCKRGVPVEFVEMSSPGYWGR